MFCLCITRWTFRGLTVCSTEISPPKGRVIYADGRFYYSPNCTRAVEVPTSIHDPFANPATALSKLRQPQWWTRTFGWLGFMPIEPSYTGHLFDRLAHVPYECEQATSDSYRLKRNVMERWQRLELALEKSVLELDLKSAYCNMACAARPPLPSKFGYYRTHKSPGVVRRQAFISRDFFAFWMGLLSHLIAVGSASPQHSLGWFKVLSAAGVEQSWLSSLQASQVCSFASSMDRAGIFIQLHDTGSIDSILWHRIFNVPVWYPWGALEQSLLRSKPKYSFLAPSPEQVQAALPRPPLLSTVSTENGIWPPANGHWSHSAETFSISPDPDTSALAQSSENPVLPERSEACQAPSECGSVVSTGWQEFFRAREARHAVMAQHESRANRQKRENRERTPPTRRTKMFEWTRNSGGQWTRVPVVQRAFEDMWEIYSHSQQRYDPWENEWDFCEEFGAPDPVDPDDFEDIGVLIPCPPTAPGDRRPTPPPSPPPPSFHDTELPADRDDILYILGKRHGFVPPLVAPPSYTPAQAVSPSSWKVWMRSMSVEEDPSNTFLDKSIVDFLEVLSRTEFYASNPPEDVWDLRAGNRCSIQGLGRLQQLRVIGRKEYLLSNAPRYGVHWFLCLTTATDVFHANRLNPFTTYDVARSLLERGVPFRTLLSLESGIQPVFNLGPPNPQYTRTIPIRLSGYVFGPRDYAAYLSQRSAILSQPHARAALLKGGIVWRLAKDVLSYDAVLQGPSSSATIFREGYSVRFINSPELVDDDISEVELDLICGLYTCYTGEYHALSPIIYY